jgi:hypothetical protein
MRHPPSAEVTSLAAPHPDKLISINSCLSKHACQCAHLHLPVHRYDATLLPTAHDHVTAALPYLRKSHAL